MIQILLVHNSLTKSSITWLSYIIRMFTCSKWNHIAIRIDDEVIESKGNGVTKMSYNTWLVYSDRQVLPLTPAKKVDLDIQGVTDTIGLTYGFLDLAERAKQIKKERWDGEEYIEKDHKGLICSDLACILLRIPKRYMPSDFQDYPNLIKGKVYKTYKK